MNSEPSPRDRLFDEANAWHFRLRADDVSAAERSAFRLWHDASPAHAQAWAEVQDLLAALRAPAQAAYAASHGDATHRPSQNLARFGGHATRWAQASAAAIALVGLAILFDAPAYLDRAMADRATATGERQTVALADGSRVELNTDTALSIEFTDTERRLTLLRGEAFFEVASNPDRPFVVAAQGTQARAVGTAFAVRVRDGRTAVTVTEGVVEVSRDAAPRAPARLRVGEGIEAGPDGLSPLRTIDAASTLAWRRGQIVFHQQPLSAVVAELNRYRTGRIVIASSKIADRIVSGTFEIGRPDSVPQVLETALGIQARSITPWLVVLN